MPAEPTPAPDSAQARALGALRHLLAPLQPQLDDGGITEILINGPAAHWVERAGSLERIPARLDEASLRTAARLFATLAQVDTLDRECVLEGSWGPWRVTLVLPPVSGRHACLALRRHAPVALPLQAWQRGERTLAEDTLACAASADDAADGGEDLPQALRAALARRDNLLIAGATGSGKTTLLASLLAELGTTERLVCLEDTPELPELGPHQLGLHTRAGHSLRSLLRLALRLRPDRLVIGEVRGAEAFDLLQAMATGHRGCLGTIHARDPAGALARLEQLVMTSGLAWPLEAIQAQIAQCIHGVVQVERQGSRRTVVRLMRLQGCGPCGYRLVSELPARQAPPPAFVPAVG